MLYLTGYILAVLIGFCLGLIGGGGSILVIPVLVLCFGIDPVIATTYSLFIVGMTACAGAVGHVRSNNIDYPKLFSFGIASVTALFLVRRYLMPLIPEMIYSHNYFSISKSLLVMFCFSVLMMMAGIRMIKKKQDRNSDEKINEGRLIVQGIITGIITGCIGIGGGFIIVPSLVLFARLPMKKAIGTSLVIITINCIVGLVSNTDALQYLDFKFLFIFCSLTVIGIIGGSFLTKHICEKTLKPVFGWIIISMSSLIFLRNFLH